MTMIKLKSVKLWKMILSDNFCFILVKLTACFHEFSKYEFTNFLYKILCNTCFDSFKCSKLRKKMPFLTNKELVFFFNWEILVKKFVDSYSEKFVKTCRDLNNRRRSEIDKRTTATVDHNWPIRNQVTWH